LTELDNIKTIRQQLADAHFKIHELTMQIQSECSNMFSNKKLGFGQDKIEVRGKIELRTKKYAKKF